MSYNFVDLFININCLNNSTTTPAQCTDETSSRLFLYYGLIPAILITFLFALTKKRRSILLEVFWGRPGVVYAMDSMSRHSRLAYACAFGASAIVVYRIVFGQAKIIDYNGSITSFLNLVYMFVYGMTFLPVFVSLTMGSVFGYGLGALYVWLLTAGQLYELAQCYITAEGIVLLIFRNVPCLLCLLYLSISIPLRFVRFVHGHRPWFVWTNESSDRCDTLEDIRNSSDGNYVADIFTKPKEEKVRFSEGRMPVIKEVLLPLIEKFVYKRKRGFRYPSRLLSILFLTAVVAYIVAFEGMTLLLRFFMVLKECVDEYTTDEEEKYELKQLINVLIASSILSTLTVAGLFIFSALGILTNYRNHVMEMYKGKVTSIPRSETTSPATDCTSYIKYGGYQAAYLIWAFLIQFVILFLLFFFFGYLMLRFDLVTNFLQWIWPYLSVFIIVNIVLWILSKYLFLQDNGSYLALSHRGLLFNCVYFVTFYFLFLGLFSLLLRLFMSLVLGVIYLGRLDKTIMVKNFEVFDLGFNTYVGFMKTDCAHSHPVLIVFTRLMLLAARSREVELPTRSGYQALGEFYADYEVKYDSLARRRWHLLYTLHCNPTLCSLRKGHVGSQS
ncbi:hypothetical protein C0Q70_21365 [Pomacea canaliculata]|uniref:Receptor for retinol uptake STRA6 n=1 Tax=Pomacea canaliculata TaxID=400727 RepID=A0A2T7NCE8_POMCA|nr:stimulated by retinoic acid gene 6 protein-like isoform X2 [Pomacea canaliculata]PVD18812.1 hypothetical protein C0Q70_21365 [Pomacea canaliculata]